MSQPSVAEEAEQFLWEFNADTAIKKIATNYIEDAHRFVAKCLPLLVLVMTNDGDVPRMGRALANILRGCADEIEEAAGVTQ